MKMFACAPWRKTFSVPLVTRNFIKLQFWFRRPLPRLRTGRFFYSPHHSPILWGDTSTRTLNSQIFLQLKGSLRNWLERTTCPNAELPPMKIWDYRSSDYDDLFILGCDIMWLSRGTPFPSKRLYHYRVSHRRYRYSVPRHVTKSCRWSRSIAPPIPNLGTRRRWIIFTSLSFYLRETTLVPTEQEAGWAPELQKRVMPNTRRLRNWFCD